MNEIEEKSKIETPMRPIPHVMIAAFCELQETAAAMEVVFQDRRIRTAISKLRMGGVAAAVDAYSEAPTPNLLIVEILDSVEHARADLERLAEVCDAGTRVMVVGGVNDVSFFKEMVGRGISEYLVTPLNPVDVVAAIVGLFDDPSAGSVGKLIAVTGVKGGVGASTIAHNIGWSLAQEWQQSVAVCELDPVFGTLSLNFSREPSQSVAEALRTPDRIDRIFVDRMLTAYSDRLRLLGGQCVVDDRVEAITPEAVSKLLSALRDIVPLVVVDLPSGWNPASKMVLTEAETVVLVAEPDLTSLRNMRNLNEALTAARLHDAPPLMVLNKVGMPKRAEIPASEFDSSVETDMDVIIPFDVESFVGAENLGEVLMSQGKESEASENLAILVAKCYGAETTLPARRSGLSKILASLLGR